MSRDTSVLRTGLGRHPVHEAVVGKRDAGFGLAVDDVGQVGRSFAGGDEGEGRGEETPLDVGFTVTEEANIAVLLAIVRVRGQRRVGQGETRGGEVQKDALAGLRRAVRPGVAQNKLGLVAHSDQGAE